VRKKKKAMWLVPYHGASYIVKIDLGRPRHVTGLRFWNYNSSVEGTYRGVKRVLVFLDSLRLSPSEVRNPLLLFWADLHT
jgi:hypothetical protein